MDITFKNVSYIYQPNTPFEHQALKDVSFYIPSGSFVAIIGHTGSGKSTLIQHLNGLIRPTNGEVIIGDYRIKSTEKLKQMKELRHRVGVVFQYPEHQLFEETVEKDIAFGPENFGTPKAEIKSRIEEILPRVGLAKDILSRSPLELSGGQMRRVAIAGVLATNPSVYVLDEPTAGLDPRGQKEIMHMFKQLHEETHNTTILITHSMEDAMQYADYIIILNQGSVYMEGSPVEVFKQEEKLRQVQLRLPENIRLIRQFNEQFQTTIPDDNLSAEDIASHIAQVIRSSSNG